MAGDLAGLWSEAGDGLDYPTHTYTHPGSRRLSGPHPFPRRTLEGHVAWYQGSHRAPAQGPTFQSKTQIPVQAAAQKVQRKELGVFKWEAKG